MEACSIQLDLPQTTNQYSGVRNYSLFGKECLDTWEHRMKSAFDNVK